MLNAIMHKIECEALGIIFGVKRFNQYLFNREFILLTDHHPKCRLLGYAEGVRPLAAARMQRWALILSAYLKKIEFTPGVANQCADYLPRLPVPSQAIHPAVEGSKVHAMNNCTSPITACEIAKSTAKDNTLSKVFTCVLHGSWPSPLLDSLLPYYCRKLKLTIKDGCLLWGKWVIIPQKEQLQLLEELHIDHLGICRMKALA